MNRINKQVYVESICLKNVISEKVLPEVVKRVNMEEVVFDH
jgi:hypothetical protein